MRFERARRLADAVLLEGYVLYPYRASSRKNRFRWAFGVLAPRAWSEAGGCEPWWLESQCLIQASGPVRLEGALRFLQQQTRRIEEVSEPFGAPPRFVDRLEVDGALHLPWEEGLVQEIGLDAELRGAAEQEVPFGLDAGVSLEAITDAGGNLRGRTIREHSSISGRIVLRVEPVESGVASSSDRLLRLIVRVENLTPWFDPAASRERILPSSFIATHLLLSARGGDFISLLDPPEWARNAAAGCQNTRTYPVLAGEEGRNDLVLSSPIILYDHAQIAPESHGDFFDACEIDEMLTLRTSLLTEDEKRQARATDPRAAALIDRVEGIAPEAVERLHGAFRDLRKGEMVPRSRPHHDPSVPGPAPGTRVRLRPGKRRTDAQDFLFEGCTARVEAVLRDVDDRTYVAVTIEGDPAAELHRWYGRFHYYEIDELELLQPAEKGTPP